MQIFSNDLPGRLIYRQDGRLNSTQLNSIQPNTTGVRMRNGFAFLSLMALLARCSMGWSKPGASRSDFDRDSFSCQKEAAQMYPVAIQAPSTYVASVQTKCNTMGNQTNCTSSGFSTPVGGGQDANAVNRTIAFTSCMKSREWQWSTSSQPSAATESNGDKNKAVRDSCIAACTDDSCKQHCWAFYPKLGY